LRLKDELKPKSIKKTRAAIEVKMVHMPTSSLGNLCRIRGSSNSDEDILKKVAM
jgi:hypothetical protein